ncbi:hypothetical protein WL80_32740 [Burkholderia ubonensis]|uniref:kelch repeat-containing protein n=1 Tax=Burkholderia ubonensis TaxID=101571 RepID=UPI0007570F3C|nr:kelch repeat-containing protein [Burkholderia ubonensis]KWE98819.1 hypothetical protein WL80_32740 [Burkholderia ubonensis]
MDFHAKNWSPVVESFVERFGAAVHPDKTYEIEPKLVQLLVHELPQYDRQIVQRAVDGAFRQTEVAIDWRRFICLILSLLPGWWTKLTNNPGFGASTMLLLTDGTVMCQEQGGLRWKKLAPDTQGSYVNGTWSDLAPMHYTRRYFASAVLRDGRVFVAGGEYSNAGSDTKTCEIYDPILDAWTDLTPPAGWTQVGDAICAVLPDGRVLLGSIGTTNTAIFDPATDTFSAGPIKGSTSSEESWVLLPDETVITVRCDGSRRADKYVFASNTWVDGGTLPTSIIETTSSEIGAGVLLENGKALFAGANGHNALYTPPAVATDTGTWTMAPDFPNDPVGRTVGCKDAPACLMTNGKVLIAAGPVDGVGGDWLMPTYFYEYDGAAMNRVSDPGNAAQWPYIGRMVLLPTGQILFAAQTNEIYVYNYYGCPSAAARPQITSAPSQVRPFHTYVLQGHVINGLSQAVGYGDDVTAATNYPLVRIRHLGTGQITYCRTFDHSTMAVATGSAIESTNFLVPWSTPEGASELVVVANGIASTPVPLLVEHFHINWPLLDEAIFSRLIGSFADGPLWVLGPNGPVPVDPWGPTVAREAEAARKQLVSALMTLRKLGDEVANSRQKDAAAVPLAPDETGENGERSEAGQEEGPPESARKDARVG